MTSYVVDTNVAIAANARDTHADLACQKACVSSLSSLVKREVVAIDDEHLIIDEYRRHLHHSGMPGVGDMFFKHVFNNQYQPTRIHRVKISRVEDDERGFEELPPNAFDRSDRKFLAVAVVANATVVNATDSDWNESAALMSSLGVQVRQLCPNTPPSRHSASGHDEGRWPELAAAREIPQHAVLALVADDWPGRCRP